MKKVFLKPFAFKVSTAQAEVETEFTFSDKVDYMTGISFWSLTPTALKLGVIQNFSIQGFNIIEQIPAAFFYSTSNVAPDERFVDVTQHEKSFFSDNGTGIGIEIKNAKMKIRYKDNSDTIGFNEYTVQVYIAVWQK